MITFAYIFQFFIIGNVKYTPEDESADNTNFCAEMKSGGSFSKSKQR